MPIFEFNCQDCGYHFEKLVLREQKKVICPQCGSHSVKKIGYIRAGIMKPERYYGFSII